MKCDHFGKFMVYALYGVAAICAAWPFIGLIVDPGDRGHFERFVLCWLVALGFAVGGKLLSVLVVWAFRNRNTGHDQST